jgi:exosortase
VLVGMVDRWTTDPKYSHGYLVPLFALWLLWSRYRLASAAGAETWSGSWWGLPVVALAVGLHVCGELFFVEWLSEVSLLVVLPGLGLGLGGWRLVRLAWPSIGFLAFMLPLPYRAEVALTLPLQRLATIERTCCKCWGCQLSPRETSSCSTTSGSMSRRRAAVWACS